MASGLPVVLCRECETVVEPVVFYVLTCVNRLEQSHSHSHVGFSVQDICHRHEEKKGVLYSSAKYDGYGHITIVRRDLLATRAYRAPPPAGAATTATQLLVINKYNCVLFLGSSQSSGWL